MKRPAIIAAALLVCACAFAQTGDREHIERVDFSPKLIKETPPDGANCAEKALWTVRKQMTGRDFYEPANYMFMRPAIKTLGFIPAVFATSDRILRDSKIGTAGAIFDSDDHKIHEGPEAYLPEKRKQEK